MRKAHASDQLEASRKSESLWSYDLAARMKTPRTPVVLPEAWLRCVDPADRKKLGKGGITAQETRAKAEATTEKQLQRQICDLLRLKGIEANVSRMDRRKTDRVGWPDITFAVWPFAVVWEIKLHGKLTNDQEQMAIRLQLAPNCWRWTLITSLDQAIKELRAIGVD